MIPVGADLEGAALPEVGDFHAYGESYCAFAGKLW